MNISDLLRKHNLNPSKVISIAGIWNIWIDYDEYISNNLEEADLELSQNNIDVEWHTLHQSVYSS